MKNRTALVTGASRGIGRGIAVRLAKCGYNVIINYKQNHAAAAETAAIAGEFGRVIVVQADVSDAGAVDRLYKAAKENFGFVDTLVNNAGVAHSGLLIDETDKCYDDIMNTNVRGAFNVCRRFLPDMMSQGFGRVVNISSIWGVTGAAMESVYSMSKAAIIGLTKALSKEAATMGVTVNAIAPGAIDTDMLRVLGDEVLQKVVENTMAGRLGTPEDIATAVEFLAGESASFISGQVLGINGEFLNNVG